VILTTSLSENTSTNVNKRSYTQSTEDTDAGISITSDDARLQKKAKTVPTSEKHGVDIDPEDQPLTKRSKAKHVSALSNKRFTDIESYQENQQSSEKRPRYGISLDNQDENFSEKSVDTQEAIAQLDEMIRNIP